MRYFNARMRRRSWVGPALKLGLFVGLTAGLVYPVIHRTDLHELARRFREPLGPESWLLLGLTALLVPVNWWFEARKWQLLVGRLAPIPARRAFRAVLAGVTLACSRPTGWASTAGACFSCPRRSDGLPCRSASSGAWRRSR